MRDFPTYFQRLSENETVEAFHSKLPATYHCYFHRMPPKQQAPAAAQVPKNFSLTCRVSDIGFAGLPPEEVPSSGNEEAPKVEIPPLLEGYRLRIFSKWCNCSVTTPMIGDKAMPWVLDEDKTSRSISFSIQFDGEASTPEQLAAFHSDPNIYCVAFSVSTSGIKPATFFGIDCSEFLFANSQLKVTRKVSEDIQVALLLSNEKPMSELSSLLPLEPLCLKFRR